MARKRSNFRGKTRNDAERQKSRGSSYGYLNLPSGYRVFKEPKDGQVTIDILAYMVKSEHHPDREDKTETAVPGTEWYKLPFLIHRNVGNDSVVCPSTFGKKCPICEYRTKLNREGADQEDVKALNFSRRNLYLIRVIESPEKDDIGNYFIWEIAQSNFQNLLNDELEYNEELGDFPDLQYGYNLQIRFTKKTLGKNSFGEASRIDFFQRDEQYPEDLVDQLPCLDEVLNVLSYEELERKFMEIDEEDVEKTQETRQPIGKTAPPPVPTRTTRKPINKGSEDEEQETEETTMSAPSVPPRRAKKAVAPTPVSSASAPEPVPNRRRKKPEPAEVDPEEDRCPHGHRFGVDTEKFEECATCEIWDACIEVFET